MQWYFLPWGAAKKIAANDMEGDGVKGTPSALEMKQFKVLSFPTFYVRVWKSNWIPLLACFAAIQIHLDQEKESVQH